MLTKLVVCPAMLATLWLTTTDSLASDLKSKLVSGRVSCGVASSIYIFRKDEGIDGKEYDDPGTSTLRHVRSNTIQWYDNVVKFTPRDGETIISFDDKGALVLQQGGMRAVCQ